MFSRSCFLRQPIDPIQIRAEIGLDLLIRIAARTTEQVKGLPDFDRRTEEDMLRNTIGAALILVLDKMA